MGPQSMGADHHRRDFQAYPVNAVVVRQGNGRDYGPGVSTVVLTTASVDQPLPPCDADEDRRRIEIGWLKERQPLWRLKHPPQRTARAVRVHVLFPWLLFALAPASRLPCEPADTGGEPPSRGRHTPAIPGQVRAHSAALSLYRNFSTASSELPP
jgi:hypothetical protein